MQFKTHQILATLSFFAATTSPAPLDVWDPTILTPTTGTVWTVGQTANVTWSLVDEPANVSNAGGVQLVKGGVNTGLGFITDPPEFDLSTGYVELVVPNVTLGTDYQIIHERRVSFLEWR